MRTLRVEVWSDIACPWCYVGKRRLEAAVAGMQAPDRIAVVYRSFELDPSAPRVQPASRTYAERLAAKYGITPVEAADRLASMAELGAGAGISLRFDLIRPGNTFDAHRLLHLARERGLQGAVKERLFRGYFTEGEPIGDPEALLRLSAEAGLEAGEARRVLEGDAYAGAVRADEGEAQDLGIRAVPFFILDGRVGVAGAQPEEVLHLALTRAWRGTTDQGASPTAGP